MKMNAKARDPERTGLDDERGGIDAAVAKNVFEGLLRLPLCRRCRRRDVQDQEGEGSEHRALSRRSMQRVWVAPSQPATRIIGVRRTRADCRTRRARRGRIRDERGGAAEM